MTPFLDYGINIYQLPEGSVALQISLHEEWLSQKSFWNEQNRVTAAVPKDLYDYMSLNTHTTCIFTSNTSPPNIRFQFNINETF